MINPNDLPGVNSDLALRVIGGALSIAPCLDSLPDGRNRDMAIAILKGIASEAATRGSRHIRGQRIGPASVEYSSVTSWFSEEDRNTLRSLCGSPASAAGVPIGRFPSGGVIAGLWPEDNDL